MGEKEIDEETIRRLNFRKSHKKACIRSNEKKIEVPKNELQIDCNSNSS